MKITGWVGFPRILTYLLGVRLLFPRCGASTGKLWSMAARKLDVVMTVASVGLAVQ